MEDTTVTLTAEEAFREQSSFNWDSLEPYSAHNTQPCNHGPAGSPEQEPAANLIAGSAGDSPTPVCPAVDRVHDAADGGPPDNVCFEPSNQDAEENAEPAAIPPGGQIPITYGREAMTSRAVRLYGEVGRMAGFSPIDLRIDGDPIFVDKTWVKRLREMYMANDKKYQGDRKDDAGNEVTARREHRRAWDRARQKINRAFDDLISVFAADEIVDSESGETTGYRVCRLPEARRRQLEHGAESALPRPGGGRIMVDAEGREVDGRRC